jgi:hypothetical protein
LSLCLKAIFYTDLYIPKAIGVAAKRKMSTVH